MNSYHSIKTIVLTILIFVVTLNCWGQEVAPSTQKKIEQQMVLLKEAHLESNPEFAERIYHKDLVLTSQSGKKYGKETALINLKNSFELYQSSAVEFLQITEDVVLTNYINERKYTSFEKGTFRLTVIWKLEQGTWQIISMQSSRIKKSQ